MSTQRGNSDIINAKSITYKHETTNVYLLYFYEFAKKGTCVMGKINRQLFNSTKFTVYTKH